VSADGLDKARAELRRLAGLPDEVAAEVMTGIFADPDHVGELYARPRSTEELRACLEAQARAVRQRADSGMKPPAELAATAVAAFWRWAHAGFGVVDADTYQRRLQACAGCEYFRDAPPGPLHAVGRMVTGDSKVCGLCGCFMSKKARYATESCPAPHSAEPGLTRWGEPAEARRPPRRRG